MSNKVEATYHGSDLEPAVPGPIESSLMAEPEADTIGSWAGAPKPEDNDVEKAAERFHAEVEQSFVKEGLRSLVMLSGENSYDHGFHDDWPTDEVAGASKDPAMIRAVGLAITEKLALIHEEISESLGEIRDGRDPLETYFVDKKGAVHEKGAEFDRQVYGNGTNHPDDHKRPGDVPLLKPEGFLVELADAAIRIADLVYLVGGREEFIKAWQIKHEYNATRPYKHGRKF